MKLLPACMAMTGCLAVAALAACSGGERRNVLVPDGSPSLVVMDFRQPFALDPPPEGWHHRTFFRTDPMQMSFASKQGRPAIRLATHRGGSMLYRFTDLPLDQYPLLAWGWFGWSRRPFPHYAARGGDENAGRWHDENVDLRTLYRKHWGDPRGARLEEVALFCDTDATGAQSVAYFSAVRVERAP